jgi:hypothetical protein
MSEETAARADGKVDDLVAQIRVSVTYEYMPMKVRMSLAEAADMLIAQRDQLTRAMTLADRAIGYVEDAVKDTHWGQPTFGPDYGEGLRAEFDALTNGRTTP